MIRWKTGSMMMKKTKLKIEAFLSWVESHKKPLFYFAIFIYLMAIIAVLCLWALGYIANANFGKKYELQSCWAGVSAILAGMIPLGTMAATLWKQETESTRKYMVDSEFNSIHGQMPEEREKFR